MDCPILGYIVSFISGGLAGALINWYISYKRGRLQKMRCEYVEDEVQHKYPVKIDSVTYNNVHFKRFDIINTTNIDISKFTIRFAFDLHSTILEAQHHSKRGFSKAVKIDKRNKNECRVFFEDFNRKDNACVTFRVANITDNSYYCSEMNSIGFKIKCCDKRKDAKKSKSLFSKALS